MAGNKLGCCDVPHFMDDEGGPTPVEEYSLEEYLAVAVLGFAPNAQNLTTLMFVGSSARVALTRFVGQRLFALGTLGVAPRLEVG